MYLECWQHNWFGLANERERQEPPHRTIKKCVSDLTGYRIFMRKKDSNAIDFVQLLETKDQNILEYQIGYLEKETEYEFRVRARSW